MSFIHIFLLAAVCSSLAAGLSCPSGNPILRRDSLSCGNKQSAVDFHNKIRNHVASGRLNGQPKAADMQEMYWSEPLARLAQKRADSCDFKHGDLILNGNRVGQNLAIIMSSVDDLKLNLTYMIELWYNEVFDYGFNGQVESRTGHYSQLIWGNTREVGCGYTYYKEDGWYKMYLACNYYPPGNYIGEKPYSYDKFDCKKYGLFDSRKYSKLCSFDPSKEGVCKSQRNRFHFRNKISQDPDNSSEAESMEAIDESSTNIDMDDNADRSTTNVYDVTTSKEVTSGEFLEITQTTETNEVNSDTTTPTTTDNSVNQVQDTISSSETDEDQDDIPEPDSGEKKGTAKFSYETNIFSKGLKNGHSGTFRFTYEPANPNKAGTNVELEGVKANNDTIYLASKLLDFLTMFRL